MGQLALDRGQEEGLNTVIINPSVILAAADWNRSSAKLFKYVNQRRPFYIDAFLNYVDVRDVATCTYHLLDAEHQSQRFIINAGNIPFKFFFEKVANYFQVKAPSLKLSRNTVKLLARAENIRTWLTKSEPLITRETAQLADTQFLYDNKKIQKILDFQFQTIDTTLEWCCSYYTKKFDSKK